MDLWSIDLSLGENTSLKIPENSRGVQGQEERAPTTRSSWNVAAWM